MPARLRPGLSVVLSLCAMLLAVIALVHSWPGRTPAAGRSFTALALDDLTVREPRYFPLDDLYLMRLDDEHVVALYLYIPGFFGHIYGCTIRWEPERVVEGFWAGTGATPSPPSEQIPYHEIGVWSDGCGGSTWDAGGRHLTGPGFDLDRFDVDMRHEPDQQVVYVHGQRLRCAHPECKRVQRAP